MASVTDLAQGLGTELGNATPAIRYLPYLSDTFTPPCALIGIDDVAYNGAFGAGIADHRFIVYLVLARADDRAALAAMEAYMSNTGAQSIRQILQADQTLGGIAAGVKVTHSGPPAAISQNSVPFISCPFEVYVYAA